MKLRQARKILKRPCFWIRHGSVIRANARLEKLGDSRDWFVGNLHAAPSFYPKHRSGDSCYCRACNS